MSVTFSDTVAAALIDAASQAGMAGRRLVFSGIYGLQPHDVYAALSSRLDSEVAIDTGNGGHVIRAVTLSPGHVLLAYLVDETAPGSNSGGRGFAATLRTQFLAGAAEDRTLLVLDERPVETVRSATEDASELPELQFDALVARAVLEIHAAAGADVRPLAESVAQEFAERADRTVTAFGHFCEWAARHARGPESTAGAELWTLGCFISDPEAHTDADRLAEGAWWRAHFDERYASQSKSWDAEVRKLLARRDVSPEVTDAIAAAAGAFGIDYTQFKLSDLKRRDEPPPLLRLDDYEPVRNARAALRGEQGLVVWLRQGESELSLGLQRETVAGDMVRATWATGDETDAALERGSRECAVRIPEGTGWSFGRLELRSRATGGSSEQSQVLPFAIFRSGGSWFPVEDRLVLDDVNSAFVCEGDPSVVVYGENERALGRGGYELPEDDDGIVELAIRFRDRQEPLPVNLVGDAGPEDPPDDGADDPADPEDSAPSDVASIPHGLLAASMTEWPEASLVQESEDGPWKVRFTAGQQRRAVRVQEPAGLDGAATEQAILRHPEWTSYVWSAPDSLSRASGLVIAGGDLDSDLATAFLDARAAFFAVARSAGSVYATDPSSAEATTYVDAYRALLASIRPEQRYLSDWDALLLCDAVFVGGRQDLLIAPTSPLAVAFHAALINRMREWVDAKDCPAPSDLATLNLRHALPLVSGRKQWYEATATDELLWRRYVPLVADAPGMPERNASYISERLRFFLRVHPSYRREDQTLSVAFYEPATARHVFKALRSFYSRERAVDEYHLPRLQVWLIGGPADLEREVTRELAGGRQDDLDQVVQNRITVTIRRRDEPRPFAHVSFLFRSPGERGPRSVDMADRPPTAYLNGLAAAPGRRVYSERNQVFAWGTWTGHGSGAYYELLERGLELVGGQPTGRVSRGWTQMASTSLDTDALDDIYGERSIWVVHLDRLTGIEAFGKERQLIEYEERADPEEPGYDGITATEQIDPYLDAVGRALRALGSPKERALRRILQLLNAVSGRWAIELLHRGDTDILQRIGFVSAISALEQLEASIGSSDRGTGVLIALDELIPGRPHAGLPRFTLPVALPEGRMCDDLLLLWIPREVPEEGIVTIRGVIIEVKYSGTGRASVDTARLEIERTREWLHRAFNSDGSSRPFRARDLAELITAGAARAATFKLGHPGRTSHLDRALRKIVACEYELDLTHWRGGQPLEGLVISVEAESSVAAHAGELPPPGRPVGLVRLGRPVLRQLVADGRASLPGTQAIPVWKAIRFEPPSDGNGAAHARGGPIEPGPADRGSDQEDAAGQEETPPAGHTLSSGPPVPTFPPADLEEMATALDQVMAKYKLATEPFQTKLAQVGPNVIRFRTRSLGPLSVSDVERRARDIGREIGAPAAVIVSQEPRYICVDVPREERVPILYRDIVPVATSSAGPGALNFILGVAPSGDIHSADLARLPHLLVAGATGSGKSVFLRGMLCHLVRSRGPQALRILLVDPKQLDFAAFAGLPHLERGRIISDPAEASQALAETIERELEWRRPVLIEAGVTSATEFYERGGTYEQLPQMVVLIDEFADLVGVLGKERRGFDDLIQRYAQLTRAFGIYLVLATQRPSVDVITGSIKANLTARVALSLPSHRDSMTVLDRPGAEDLLGNGDMLFYHSGRVDRLQGAFADGSDVAQAIERWRGVANPDPRARSEQ